MDKGVHGLPRDYRLNSACPTSLVSECSYLGSLHLFYFW